MPELTGHSVWKQFEPFPATGRVRRIALGVIEADGPDMPVGAHCEIVPGDGWGRAVRAQVAAVSAGNIVLAPFETVAGLGLGDQVLAIKDGANTRAGPGFAGRAVNGLGKPIDGGTPLADQIAGTSIPGVLDRASPSRSLQTGIRVIDGLLTIGHGQRIGVFAASGVGKTRLVEQILAQHDCSRAIVCLIGERGREVEALWRNVGQTAQRERITLIAATSDELAPMRVQALEQALALAEYWRAAGEDVLLIVDSITRYAMALREIGLMAGEPPTLRAYTPNIFRELPIIVERCGAERDKGTITAIFTVLSESDDVDDPLVEVVKSLLDGHVVLSRRLAQAGHFPAVDVGKSISRLFDRLVDGAHCAAAVRCRAALARYEESRILIESGMYKAGSDRELDAAIAARSAINAFARQDSDDRSTLAQTRDALLALIPPGVPR